MSSNLSSYGHINTSTSKLYYEREGDKAGPTILFIHGLGGTTNTYQPLISSLQDFDLVRFDFAGHGRSTVPQQTTIDSYVEDCEAVIAHFDLKDITVVGHSLGCLVAMTLAAKQPSLVLRLVLFGPIKAPPQAGRDGATARAETVRKGGMAAVADTIISNAFAASTLKSRPEIVSFGRELLSRQNAEGYALACLALANSEDPRWKSIQAKTTIVSGAEDKVSNPTTCKAIAENLGGSNVDLITWDGVGHWHTLENAIESAHTVKQAVQK